MDAERIEELRTLVEWGVVQECLDEIERLRFENERVIAQYAMLRSSTEATYTMAATYEQWMPDVCPWCGNGPQVRRPMRGGAPCGNSWHPDHKDHHLMWPMWRKVN